VTVGKHLRMGLVAREVNLVIRGVGNFNPTSRPWGRGEEK